PPGGPYTSPPVINNAGVPIYMCPARNRTAFTTAGGNSPSIDGPHTDYKLNVRSNGDGQNGFYGVYIGNSPVPPHMPKLTMATVTSLNGTSNTIFFGEGSIDPSSTNGYVSLTSAGWDENIYSGGYGGTNRSDVNIIRDAPGNGGNSNNWGSAHDAGTPFML